MIGKLAELESAKVARKKSAPGDPKTPTRYPNFNNANVTAKASRIVFFSTCRGGNYCIDVRCDNSRPLMRADSADQRNRRASTCRNWISFA